MPATDDIQCGWREPRHVSPAVSQRPGRCRSLPSPAPGGRGARQYEPGLGACGRGRSRPAVPARHRRLAAYSGAQPRAALRVAAPSGRYWYPVAVSSPHPPAAAAKRTASKAARRPGAPTLGERVVVIVVCRVVEVMPREPFRVEYRRRRPHGRRSPAAQLVAAGRKGTSSVDACRYVPTFATPTATYTGPRSNLLSVSGAYLLMPAVDQHERPHADQPFSEEGDHVRPDPRGLWHAVGEPRRVRERRQRSCGRACG